MNKKLTKRDVDSFSYGGGWDVRWDGAISGFGVRVYPSGKKSYILSYRNSKQQKRFLTLGQTNQIALDTARDVARVRLAEIINKIDPIEVRNKKRTGRLVNAVFVDFLEKYSKDKNKNRTWTETERLFKRDILPVFGNRLIQDVSKQDIIKLVDDVVERGSKIMANRILANLKRFFGWCVERDLIEISPAEKIVKPCIEKSRDRVLSYKEVGKVWNACDKEGYPYGHLVKFLLLTVQRKDEVANLLWDDIDFDAALWTLPKEKTKSNRRHEVHLSPLAIEILKEAKSNCPDKAIYVFTTLGDRPFSGFSKSKTRIDGIIEESSIDGAIPEWRIHDLRRTGASGMAQLGVAPHVIERVLNHSSGIISGVAAVYNRYNYQDESKQALVLWSEKVASL